MRALSPALQAAVAALGSLPDLTLELADTQPHLATVAVAGPNGPLAAALASDGALIVATFAGGFVSAQRVVAPGSPASWLASTSFSSDARAQAGVAICVSGSTVRVLWQAAATTRVLCVTSTDNGQTYGVVAILFDPGKPMYGIAAPSDLTQVIIAYDRVGIGSERLALWKLSGSWAGTDWSNPDIVGVSGLAAVPISGGYFLAITAQSSPTGGPYSVQACTLAAAGPSWSAISTIMPVDASAGLSLAFPSLAYFGGLYRLTYKIADSGGSSGVAYARCARSQSADLAHWSAPLEDTPAQTYGAAWVQHATGQLLVGQTVRFAPAYNPATQYRDLSGDVVKLDLTEQEGQPARLVATLDNTAGAYTGLAALRPNAQLLLSQGYAGAGRAATHLLYVDEWTHVRAADVRQVTIVASDRAAWMEREARRPATYANQTVAAIAADLAALAGFDVAATVDALAQFAAVLVSFALQQGESYLAALGRLLGVYDGTWRVECRPGAGVAFAALEGLHLLGKGAGDPSVYSYTDEPEVLHVTSSGDRANHVLVFGPLNVPAAYAEVWDWPDVVGTGQERAAIAVEPQAVTAAEAQVRGALEMAREQRFALQVQATTQPNPALEVCDVVTFNDPSLGATVCRIEALHLTYYPQESHFDLVIGAGGP